MCERIACVHAFRERPTLSQQSARAAAPATQLNGTTTSDQARRQDRCRGHPVGAATYDDLHPRTYPRTAAHRYRKRPFW